VGRLFGTDGVRGLANRDVTAEVALDLAVAAAHVLGEVGAFEGHRPRAVIGRDGRASGEFLSAAMVAGLASAGVDVADAGVIPTPAVAALVADTDADLGVVLSASHNPMPDNGIKFFAKGGRKLPDEVEDAIESRLREDWQRPTGGGVGRVRVMEGATQRYVGRLVAALPHRLDGLRVVVDCAHGAASLASPAALRAAGAEVIVIGADPDGYNINDGYGSTHLEHLRDAVVGNGADAGIAHDGDADRCLAIDHLGRDVDGDQIMAILALAFRERGALPQDTLVATVMSNLGLLLAMQDEGVRVVQTAVGDRYVLEAMRAGGFNVGGEQSGHIILTDFTTTGDGVVAALQLMAVIQEEAKPVSEVCHLFEPVPQLTQNVRYRHGKPLEDKLVRQVIEEAEGRLGTTGRLVVRASGTEPVIRVMGEGEDEAMIAAVVKDIAGAIKKVA